MYEPKDRESSEIRYLENDKGDGWDTYLCLDDCCIHAIDEKGEISDERAISVASMILYKDGVKDIHFLKLEREDTITYAIAPPLEQAFRARRGVSVSEHEAEIWER